MIGEFKKFLMRGNVVDLAVAVVIGVAFGAVVTSFVEDIVNPIIGLVGGEDFSHLSITLKSADIPEEAVSLRYGALISAILNFVLVAAAIFFAIVKPLNVLEARRKAGRVDEEEAPGPTEAELLAEIRDLLASRAS